MTQTIEQREAELVAAFDRLADEKRQRDLNLDQMRASVTQRNAAQAAQEAAQARKAKRQAFEARIGELKLAYSDLDRESVVLRAEAVAILEELNRATQRQKQLAQQYIDLAVESSLRLHSEFSEYGGEITDAWYSSIANGTVTNMPAVQAQFINGPITLVNVARTIIHQRGGALGGGRVDKGTSFGSGEWVGGKPVTPATTAPATAAPVKPVVPWQQPAQQQTTEPTARSVVSGGGLAAVQALVSKPIADVTVVPVEQPQEPAPAVAGTTNADDHTAAVKAWLMTCTTGDTRVGLLHDNFRRTTSAELSLQQFSKTLRDLGYTPRKKETGIHFSIAIK